MQSEPVIAILDIGKTNKKIFLFNKQYKIVYTRSVQFAETVDEDGFPCDDVQLLTDWVLSSLQEIVTGKRFTVKAINFSAYGASFVHIDKNGKAITPLYNYLKPFPEQLTTQFYQQYGSRETIALQTASPVLGSLNSGMQLYRLKYEQQDTFVKIAFSLHLPQYLSYLVAGYACSDISSIGCHTQLWDFNTHSYHAWVKQEGIENILAPILPTGTTIPTIINGNNIRTGIGLHDSSAALIPYLVNFHEPFVLISTGTWCISLHPFNETALTTDELKSDCLSYLSYKGKPVKASRLFAGYEHEQQVKRIADYFHQDIAKYHHIQYDGTVIKNLHKKDTLTGGHKSEEMLQQSLFGRRDLSFFANDGEAYHQLILDIVTQQYHSTQLVLKGASAKRIFVDGGFSKNAVYMNLMAAFFPEMEVSAASMAQATAVGAALAIHDTWNPESLPNDIIELKYYAVTESIIV